MKWVIIDLDSTLADTRHRLDCVPDEANGLSWWDYADRCLEDTPIAGTVVLTHLLRRAGIGVQVLSARPMKAYEHTVEWFKKHQIHYDLIQLLPQDDYDRTRDSHSSLRDWKVRKIREWQSQNEVFLLAIDDGIHAEEMYQQCGIPCLTVMSWYARDVLAEHPMMVGI